MTNNIHHASEEEARALAEASREQDWSGRSFLRNLFLGDLRVEWIDPFPITPLSDDYLDFEARLRHFMETQVDPVKIDETGEYGDDVLRGLADLGAFGMKIDKKYGGLGFNQREYGKAIELVAQYEGSLVALLSAAQSIGLPQPLKLFDTPDQKAKYLPRCAAGAITAFALTEPDVGSDPARLATIAERTEDGDFILNGNKLWITNGTIAEMMVVMARVKGSDRITAFIVECDWEGVEVAHRCHFMGLRALANGVITFDNVRVPKENIIHKEGAGLKVALITLNTGRLSLPVACLGGAKRSLTWVRDWSNQRVQWGLPIGQHEAISHTIADMAATTYAMDSWCDLAQELSMRDGYDIRLEAAAAKEWGSTRSWRLVDDVMQVRGGRGYETEASLKDRGDTPYPVERNFRDARINRIFEGSSEIMHLFMAREMVDKHLQVAGPLLDPKSHEHQAEGATRCHRVLRHLVPQAVDRNPPVGCLRSFWQTLSPYAVRREVVPSPCSRRVPRHDQVSHQDGTKTGVLVSHRRHRHGARGDDRHGHPNPGSYRRRRPKSGPPQRAHRVVLPQRHPVRPSTIP